jgi:hypothetical protein
MLPKYSELMSLFKLGMELPICLSYMQGNGSSKALQYSLKNVGNISNISYIFLVLKVKEARRFQHAVSVYF